METRTNPEDTMNKATAKNLQNGDEVRCTHDRKVYTVREVILASDDPRDMVPLVVTTSGTVITYRMLKEVTR